MKSKAGNKLKKIRKLTLAAGLALTGCITEPKTITEDHEIGPACFTEDSTTWTDSAEVRHLSCHYDPSVNPTPPGP